MNNESAANSDRELVERDLANDPEAQLLASTNPAMSDPDLAGSDADWQQEIDPNSDVGTTLEQQARSALAGGDVETDPYLAEVAGDEAVGGSTAIPEQNDVDELGEAAGISIPDGGILHTTEMLEHRDSDRWELDPDSAQENS